MKSTTSPDCKPITTSFIQPDSTYQSRFTRGAQRIKNGQLDLAVLAYLNEFTDTTIQLTTFDTQSFSIVVPTDDPLATNSQLQFRSLRHQHFVALKDNFVHRQAFRQLSHQNHVRPTIVFESNEIGSILNMVRQHVGIALLSNAVQLPAGLQRPLTDAQAPTFNVGVAYRHSMTFSPTQADLIQRLTAAFQSVDWHAY
ncbi:LysR substrate-binding domain-containing protein [Lactiplantibacillus plantarum]|nr:LysR substrate-binding domain-containing protein [Lactiplantibacillus plantarum]